MLTFELVDDGTIDTTIGCSCGLCGRRWEERFSQEFASEYRDDDGDLDLESLLELMELEVYCLCEEE